MSFHALRFEASSGTPHYLLKACNGVIHMLGLDWSLSPPWAVHRSLSVSLLGVSRDGEVGVDGANEPLIVVPKSAPVGVVDFEGGAAADSDEEEYGEVIMKGGAGATYYRR
jgi:hypothetical protein